MNVIKNSNKNLSNIGIIIFRIISIIIIGICLSVLYKWHQNNIQNNDIIHELSEFVSLEDTNYIEGKIEYENENSENNIEDNNESLKLLVNFDELKHKNSDTVAWVKVNNTNINFPVVQSVDNDFYLKRNFNKNPNGAGWIFADYRNSFDILDKNTIVYGHNRRNGTMFGNLTYLIGNSWNFENENSYFYFSTEKASYRAQIFSVYMMKATKLSIPNKFDDNMHFENYIKDLKSLSICSFDVYVSSDDNIITLCTCDNTSQNRIVVHAKLIN